MITDSTALTWALFLVISAIIITTYSTIQEYMWQKTWEKHTRDKIQFIIFRTIAPSFTLALLLTIITFVITMLANGTHNTF